MTWGTRTIPSGYAALLEKKSFYENVKTFCFYKIRQKKLFLTFFKSRFNFTERESLV